MSRLLLAIVGSVLMMAACGGKSDRVVSVETRCQSFVGVSESGQRQFVEANGGSCGVGAYNRRQQITVKPASGAPYTVDVPMEQKVTLGQNWPP